MALTHFFFATSVLILSLGVIASATDYSYDSKPDTVKPDFSHDPKPKPNIPSFGYDPKPKLDQPKITVPKPDMVKSDNGYNPKPDFPSPKPTLPKPDFEYDPKPNVDQPKPTIPKPNYGNIPKPDLPKPKLDNEKSNYEYDDSIAEASLPIGIEGLVLCKSGSNYVPIKGAVVRIACMAVDQNGYETTPFSCLTGATDAHGYYYKILPAFGFGDNLKLTECKAYLESSPLETCKIPTDVNYGMSGAFLSSYHVLGSKNIKLYSMRTFFYTSETTSTPAGGY